jgi:hypothetical protein
VHDLLWAIANPLAPSSQHPLPKGSDCQALHSLVLPTHNHTCCHKCRHHIWRLQSSSWCGPSSSGATARQRAGGCRVHPLLIGNHVGHLYRLGEAGSNWVMIASSSTTVPGFHDCSSIFASVDNDVTKVPCHTRLSRPVTCVLVSWVLVSLHVAV